MDHQYISTAVRRFLTAICALLLICYLTYHIAGMGEPPLSTAHADAVTVENTLSGEGYFFRKETVLFFPNTAAVYSTLQNGTNLAAGDQVGFLFPIGSDIAAIQHYDHLIDLLTVEGKAGDIAQISAKLQTLAAELRKNSAKGDLSALLSDIDVLKKTLNNATTATGGSSAIKAEIERLKKERAALLTEIGRAEELLYAPVAGCYYPTCDGYENLFSADVVKNLTVSAFKELTANEPAIAPSGGKIVTDSYWQMAVLMDENAVLNVQIGKEYTVYIGDAEEKCIMTLERVEVDASETDLLIFGCRVTPKNLPERCEKISLVLETNDGLAVPTAAVRVLTDENGIQTVGVYVREGGYIRFKKIEILTEQNGYYLVKAGLTDEKDAPYHYIALHDVIVTSGKELKEGYFR